MKYMTGNEIRKAYLQFFKSKEHLILHSFPLIPENDPSLLLIGAGMAPLKPYFTGKLVPPSYRVTTSQKCIRTDDIDNVGRTARHHTFFEMLGNFSFGNYFKKEAISWAWEFLTKVLELDTDKLYVTIYPDDKEAYDYWHNMIGLADERIFKFDDNFWEIGEGPCGPDSEIFYDLGPERGCGKPTCTVGCDCDRYLEIWNLVFTQYNRTKDGKYEPLAKKNIDTGCGLERLASVIQQKESNFETDLIFPIIEKVIAMEENSFLQTLEQGTDLLNQKIDAMRKAGSTVLNGEDAFQLYDTFGFPWELTEEILEEQGFTMDKEGFEKAMEAQRQVTDMTNTLLKKNADMLKTASVETAKESERSIVDIETLQHTNQQLISTLDEVLAIQQEGAAKRKAAEAELGRIEGELKQKLMELHK